MDDNTIDLELERPHSARMYDYYLGGRTNFAADREAVGTIMALFPAVLVAARANRDFMHRSTRYLAQAGLRQFLDIGTGIPTSPNLHEIAQREVPEAAVVYVDNDPIVLVHAQALLASSPQGSTAYAQADLKDPAAVLATAAVQALDLTRPVALSLNAVLHFITDEDGAHAIVDQLKRALAPGSALIISHGTPDFAPDASRKVGDVYRNAGTSTRARTRTEIAEFFTGWDLVEPGITATHRWRPEPTEMFSDVTDSEAACYAAVAIKP